MTRIAAISVQTIARPAAARPAAPVVRPVETQKPAVERRELQADLPKLAAEALAVLIAAQARHDERDDPHPEHGRDHGHKPPAPQPPPVVETPTPTPAPSPVPNPAPVMADPAAGARALAMINKVFAEGAVAEAARSAFETASAQRRAAAYVAQGQAALTLLQGIGQYERVRRSAIG